jgi:hypothetical protein
VNNTADRHREEFVERVGAALNAQADELDGATRSRLNRARQSALAEGSRRASAKHRGSNWVPAGGVAMVALFVAVILVDGYKLGGFSTGSDVAELAPLDPGTALAPGAGDLEVLMVDEELEMLRDLDFYNWLQSVPVRPGAVPSRAGLG